MGIPQGKHGRMKPNRPHEGQLLAAGIQCIFNLIPQTKPWAQDIRSSFPLRALRLCVMIKKRWR